MKFLIDENLPPSIGEVFAQKGYEVETVVDNPALRGEPDEVIFDYAINHLTSASVCDILILL